METHCRGCLSEFEPTELLQYSESNRRLFVYCTGLQVKRYDAFPFQLCKECFVYLKISCKFKKQCRSSDKKFKTYLGLKNVGEIVDFRTYLKGIEDTFTLKIPSADRVSTPIYHKNYDDDGNESTCTSIQNFMTDIRETLQEEDMLTTEDKLIREVIQEEADISDDSLDSHWLEDDNVNDFAMDFNYPAVDTPSSNENRRNTPVRITTDEEDTCHYVHKDVILKSDKTITTQNRKDRGLADVNAMNQRSDEFSDDNFTECNRLAKSSNQNDMPLLDSNDMAIDGMIDTNMSMQLNNGFSTKSVEKINEEPVVSHKELTMKQVSNSSMTFTDELQHYSNIDVTDNDNAIEDLTNFNNLSSILREDSAIITANNVEGNSISNQPISLDIVQYIKNSKQKLDIIIETDEPKVGNELEQYISKVESEKKQNKIGNEKCSIDKNLELALKNNDSEMFPLEQLLGSPQVSDQLSGGSTPLVHNILFGSITPMHEHSMSQHIMADSVKNIDSTKSLSTNNKNVKDIKEVDQNKSAGIFKKSTNSERNTTTKRKEIIDPNRSYNDITSLIELRNENAEILDSCNTNDREKDVGRKRKLGNEISEDDHLPPSKNKFLHDDDKDKITNTPVTDDLDISITNLLDFDENQSVDLNISIASDFLEEEQKKSISDNDIYLIDNDKCRIDLGEQEFDKINEIEDDKHDENNVVEQSEEVFKKPLQLADSDKYDLSKHLCKICNKRFKTVKALKLHFVQCHQVMLPRSKTKGKRVCEICGKVLADAATYSRHKKIHDGPHKCQYCFARFRTEPNLRQHIKSHINFHEDIEKPKQTPPKEKKKYLCILCDKEFKTSGNFNIHMKRHENVFKFKCENCDKGFVRKYDFEQHMFTRHSKELPFECEICSMKFRAKYLLENHVFTHLGIQKFVCEHCEMNFKSRQNLVQHYKTCVLNLIAKNGIKRYGAEKTTSS